MSVCYGKTWLVEFDQSWDPNHLSAWVRKLPPPGDHLRLSALVELVKIDVVNGYNDRCGCIDAHARVLGGCGLSQTTITGTRALTFKPKTCSGRSIQGGERREISKRSSSLTSSPCSPIICEALKSVSHNV